MTELDEGREPHTLLGPGPARDHRFVVKERWLELTNYPEGSDERKREFLHRQMNEEANVMENAAQSLVDFPTADWAIRMWLARQCADEARHVLAYRRLMEKKGVAVGEFPVLNFQFRVLQKIDSLIGRLAVENRTFEADGLDAAAFAATEARASGDDALADQMDAQQADEILHVGFANEWIRAQIEQSPGNVLTVARALTHARHAFAYVFEGGAFLQPYPVAQEARLEAGFEEAEVRAAADQSAQLRAAAYNERAGSGATPEAS